MKRATKIAIAAGLALGFGTVVAAAQPDGMGGGMRMMGGMMGGGGMMGAGHNIEERLAAQKSALKITPEQQSAWTAYADVAKKQSDAMLKQHEAMWQSAPSSSAERFDQHSKFMAQRANEHEALSVAYKDLYAVLTPEQRKLLDQRGGFGPRGPRGAAR